MSSNIKIDKYKGLVTKRFREKLRQRERDIEQQHEFINTDRKDKFINIDRKDKFINIDRKDKFINIDRKDKFIHTDGKDKFYEEHHETYVRHDKRASQGTREVEYSSSTSISSKRKRMRKSDHSIPHNDRSSNRSNRTCSVSPSRWQEKKLPKELSERFNKHIEDQ